MKRSGMLAAALLSLGLVVGVACGSAGGTSDTLTLPPADAGPHAVVVDLDGGGTVATPPDGAAACPAGTCNYQTGAGCSGATSACLPAVSGNTAVPACSPAGTVAAGAACVNLEDCVAGHVCAGGACRKLCCGGDWTGCDSATEHCIEGLSYAGAGSAIETGAMLCYPIDTCDALDPTSCTTAGTTCQIVDATGATACFTDGAGQAGQACPCHGGFTCVLPDHATSPVCVRLCKAVAGGGSPYCASDEGICTHFARDPAGVGECQPPGQP
jgi:hypothetical protein